MSKEYIVGISGASGSVYAKRLIEELLNRRYNVDVIVTPAGRVVIEKELKIKYDGKSLPLKLKKTEYAKNAKYFNCGDIDAVIASGSHRTEGVVIIPCSMATVSSVANGISSDLLERCADVALKENRKLVLVPRETPLNEIHLENMLKLKRCGADIVPAMPAFYNEPASVEEMIDFIVGKVLDVLSIENDLFKRWK